MRNLLFIAAAGAAALGACTNTPSDRSADEVNAADREGTTIHIDRNGARADLEGSEVRVGRNGIDVDLGVNEVEATVRRNEDGSISLTTNRH